MPDHNREARSTLEHFLLQSGGLLLLGQVNFSIKKKESHNRGGRNKKKKLGQQHSRAIYRRGKDLESFKALNCEI